MGRRGSAMPVHPDVPEPLNAALQTMEDSVQATKASLAYCAPEMQDSFWIALQHDLASAITGLYEAMKTT
jgi:hypothetical protein